MATKREKSESTDNISRSNTKKKNKSLGFKIGIILLTLLVFGAAAGIGYGISLYNKMDNFKLNSSELGVTPEEDLKEYTDVGKIKNIALYGVDAPNGTTGRSDAIMIATIDPIHKKIKITSIMRDSYVNIPGHGMDKITHAYAFGGPELAIRTLNENFGLNITDFATVNFSSLPQLVDALGGVTIQITDEEAPHIEGIYSAGTYTLTGAQALSYTRIRYATGDDFERTHRHRIVLSALFTKAMSMPVSSYPSTLNSILPLIQTSLSAPDILSLGTTMAGMGQAELIQNRFPQDGDYWGDTSTGVYYMKFDNDSVKKKIQNYIFEDIVE